jgi:glyoxylase-like metal-dependent hydrolase (beta-lactamase superfamily II)
MVHRVFALHLGDKRTRQAQFMYRSATDEPMTVSFYFWVVLGGPEPLVFDVGFDAGHAAERGVEDYRDRAALLEALDVRADDITTVVMSHLHWDHWSGYELFPNASFLVQRSEVSFWTDRAPRHDLIMASANRKALEALAGLRSKGRIRMLDGETRLWPGIRIVPVGGHTPGLQILVVDAAERAVILASDALHFYRNYEERRPVQVTMDFPDALDAFDTIGKLAEGNILVAGHDPSDCRRFKELAPGVLAVA